MTDTPANDPSFRITVEQHDGVFIVSPLPRVTIEMSRAELVDLLTAGAAALRDGAPEPRLVP